MNRDRGVCQICREYADTYNRWTLRLTVGKEKEDFNGHKKCIGDLSRRINKIDSNGKLAIRNIKDKLNL